MKVLTSVVILFFSGRLIRHGRAYSYVYGCVSLGVPMNTREVCRKFLMKSITLDMIYFRLLEPWVNQEVWSQGRETECFPLRVYFHMIQAQHVDKTQECLENVCGKIFHCLFRNISLNIFSLLFLLSSCALLYYFGCWYFNCREFSWVGGLVHTSFLRCFSLEKHAIFCCDLTLKYS